MKTTTRLFTKSIRETAECMKNDAGARLDLNAMTGRVYASALICVCDMLDGYKNTTLEKEKRK